MNLKPINEVPEIESLQEGDKILVNSNGAAKQIAAEKIGGSGSGVGTIYGEITPVNESNESFVMVAYADKEMNTPMTYEEGRAVFESAMRLGVYQNDTFSYLFPAMAIDYGNALFAAINLMGNTIQLTITFSDS